MALVLSDRVKETTTSTGTSDFTLGGAVTGFQTFSAGVGNSNTTYYAVSLGADWEVGLGTLSSDGLTLARTTVLQSSNSDNKVSFAAGSKEVFVTYPADKAITDVTSTDASIVVSRSGSIIDLAVSEASPASTLLAAVRNTTGATLTKGTAVYISGATGQKSTVSKALATGDSTSAQTLGLITSDLANNSNGYVTVIGLVSNINTSAYTDGAQLYLSPTTAGTLTATKPYAPDHLVYVAIVEYAHATQGKLFVRVQNGYEMDELHNVSAQSPTTGQTLVYNSSTSLWEKNTVSLTAGVNGTLPVANGGTGITSLGTGVATFLGTPSSANLAAAVTDETGAGALVFATSPTLVTPTLGTPASATLTNATGLPIATGVSGLGAGVATFLATPSSENLRSALTDETGTGSVVFSTSPTLITPDLGTPSALVGTNITGTAASFNINGTVGATTPTTGAFTTLDASGVATFSAGSAAAPAITTTGDTNTGIFFPAADTIAFTEGGTESMRIDASGNVGIGTSTPNTRLEVGGDASPILRITSTSGPYSIIQSNTVGTLQLMADEGNTGASTSMRFRVDGAEGMRLDSTGLGIGRTPVAYGSFEVLDVAGASGAIQKWVHTGSTVELQAYASSTLTLVGSATNHPLVLSTNNTNRFQIGESGQLGIGGATYGTAGQVLTSGGSGAAPTWSSSSGVVQYAQNIQSADYTLVIGDAGKQIFHPASDTSNRTFTIPANSSVAFSIGTVVLFTVENGGSAVEVSCGDTLVFGDGTTGKLAVLPNNTLMCIKVTATKWMANYLYQTGDANAIETIAVAGSGTPFISAYPWSSSGFGTKFTNPVTPPAGSGGDVAFTSAGDAIAVVHSTTPYISAYPFSSVGFGTKFADPTTLPAGTGAGVAFTSAGDAVAVAHSSTPFISAYPWSSSGFGTQFANPATLPASTGNGVAFNPAGTAIAVAHNTTPFISVYPWSGSGFGTKFTNPSTLPTGSGNGVAFNPTGTAIAVAHQNTPFISAYPWSGSGFGTKFSNPATLPTGIGSEPAFNPAGDAIAVAHASSPRVSVYPWSGSGFGTKFTNPATLPASDGNAVAFNPAGTAIAVAHGTTPFISVYPWSGSGFGTKFSNPATLPTGNGFGVAFSIAI